LKLGIIGFPACGKTSLFNMLTGALPVGTGRIGWSPKTKRGILTQHEHFPEHAGTAFSYLRDHEPKRTNQALRNTLGAMCFEGESANKPITALSGGERKRLMMTRLLLEGNNVLLLDEPTNHLDLPSREAVEFALSVFEGSLLVISHDRYFLDRLADRILWIQDARWTLTTGGFTQAQEARRKAAAPKPTGEKEAVRKPAAAPPARQEPVVPGLARLTTEALEQRIIRCEERIAALEHRHADPAVYRSGVKTRTLGAELEEARRELGALETEYQGRG
jgi:ATP-binding cassette subfamily F protein 3